jgi:hypothetical protein
MFGLTMRHITVGLLAFFLVLPACGSENERMQENASAPTSETITLGSESEGMQENASAPTSETITLEGKVHCGTVRECTGESFLVYTQHSGKVIVVIPTATRTAADVQEDLADGVRVEIAGIEKSKVNLHQHKVLADRITFLPRER